MKCKNLIVFFGAVLVLILLQCVFATKSSAEIKSGSDGDVTWTFDTETGVLTFSGTGPITTQVCVNENTVDDVTKKIVIGEGITDITDKAYLFRNVIEEIEVDENNQVYASVDGCLYNKDKSELIYWPRAKGESCVIPNGVTKIGEYAFYIAKNLKSITIPDTVTEIGQFAFCQCGIKSIIIPDSVTTIGNDAFSNCYSLESVKLSEGMTVISDGLFDECCSLKYVELSDNITSIGVDAFAAFLPFAMDREMFDSHTMDLCPLEIVIPNGVTEVTPIDHFPFGRQGYGGKLVLTTVYCKSDSTAKIIIDNWNEAHSGWEGFVEYVIDDDAPTINVSQEGNSIVIDSTDGEGVGLKKTGYSLDGNNWGESNVFTVNESGTYTVYVRDKLYNISSKEITVDIIDNKADDAIDNDKDDSAEEKEPNKTDDSQSDKVIPNTGAGFPIVMIGVIVIAVIAYRNYKKYNIKM